MIQAKKPIPVAKTTQAGFGCQCGISNSGGSSKTGGAPSIQYFLMNECFLSLDIEKHCLRLSRMILN